MGRLDRLAILKPINLLFTPNQPEVDLTQTYGVKAYACQSCAAHLDVEAARAKDDMSSVRYMGIDETSVKRGRQCITVVHELEAKRLFFAGTGRADVSQMRHGEVDALTDSSQCREGRSG